MATLKASVLTSLLSHVILGDDNDITQGQNRPPQYGATVEGYTASARVASAGTSWTELHAANLTLQSETHGRYAHTMKTADVAAKAMANRNYYLAHGAVLSPDNRTDAKYRYPDGMYAHGAAGVDARVSGATCPSGLRPRIVKAEFKAEHLRAWTAELQRRVALATGPDALVEIPVLGDLAGVAPLGVQNPRTPNADGTPRVAKTVGPFDAFNNARTALLGCITSVVSALRSADDPTETAPLGDAMADYFGAWDKWAALAAVSASAFDVSKIREGTRVTLKPGAKAHAAVALLARAGKLSQTPDVFRVSSLGLDGALAYITADGLPKALPVPCVDLARYVPPAPMVSNWVPAVGSTAMVEDIEGVIMSIDGDTATFFTTDGDEVPVPVKDLKPLATV